MGAPSDNREKRMVAMFDSFSKTVARNFSRNLKRAKENRDKHFLEEPIDYILELLSHEDRYPSDYFVLFADELSCVVYSEILYKALLSLPESQRKVLLLDFWYDLTDEEIAKRMEDHGLLNLPSDKNAGVHWLMKDMNDAYIQNILNDLRNAMYSACNHIDSNEKLQSNTSSLAIRSRLIFLEQRAKSMFDYIQDAIYDRIERLFEYLSLKGYQYNVDDVQINYTPNIPVDLVTTVQVISQLGEKLSTETALSLLPFVESPAIELEKIKKERAEAETIDLDKLG